MWDRDQQCFMESGIRLTTKTGSGFKILIVFGIRDQHFGQKYGISYEKIYLVTTLLLVVKVFTNQAYLKQLGHGQAK